ncbi:MAG: ParB/RepB/Spo0J family partition protein [Phycisphaerae bacterium]|nr:ParB/RepB/Spo0J family partition protein [Phycisphaerae bacterium]
MSKDQRRLGRGLSALIPDAHIATLDAGLRTGAGPTSHEPNRPHVIEVELDRVKPNPQQPRRAFDMLTLHRLAESIKERGTLQPILVRPSGANYELVAGERRLRAARIAGLASLPAIVRPTEDAELAELALIENLHRDDLNPLDRAEAYLSIKERLNISNEDLARRLGEDRSTVANHLRLLDLPNDVAQRLIDGELTMGHARALLGLSNPAVISQWASRIVAEGWSVRDTEQRVTAQLAGRATPAPKSKRPAVSDLEERLSRSVGTRVRIIEGRKRNTGRIVLEYYSLDDFERITGRLGVELEE